MFKHLELLNILCLLSMPAIHVLLFSKQVHKVVNLFEVITFQKFIICFHLKNARPEQEHFPK